METKTRKIPKSFAEPKSPETPDYRDLLISQLQINQGLQKKIEKKKQKLATARRRLYIAHQENTELKNKLIDSRRLNTFNENKFKEIQEKIMELVLDLCMACHEHLPRDKMCAPFACGHHSICQDCSEKQLRIAAADRNNPKFKCLNCNCETLKISLLLSDEVLQESDSQALADLDAETEEEDNGPALSPINHLTVHELLTP